MTTPRRPRPDHITRAEAEEMIRAAVAAERERSERAMAAVLQAVGAGAQTMEGMATALLDAERMIGIHTGLLKPLCEAFAAGVAMAEAAEGAADLSTVN